MATDYVYWTVIAVQAPRLIRSPSRSGTCWLAGISVPLTIVPFAGARVQDRPPAIRPGDEDGVSREIPGSVGGPVRSISGYRPRDALCRPMRICAPARLNRRSAAYAGKSIPSAPAPLARRTMS